MIANQNKTTYNIIQGMQLFSQLWWQENDASVTTICTVICHKHSHKLDLC